MGVATLGGIFILKIVFIKKMAGNTIQYTLTGIQLVGPYGTGHIWHDDIFPNTAIKGLSHHYNISSLDLAYDTGDFGDTDYQSMPWYGLFWVQSYEELQ